MDIIYGSEVLDKAAMKKNLQPISSINPLPTTTEGTIQNNNNGEAKVEEQKPTIKDDVSTELESKIHLFKQQCEIVEVNEKYYPSKTFINCDLRYFNFDFLTKNFGSFDGKNS